MSPDKARDLFSSYYDGTLDAGLRQALERSFEQDRALKSDYQAFTVTMERLGLLAKEEIELPIFLSDRIATRLEASKAKKKPSLFSPLWARNFAFGGLGLAVILGAIFTFNQVGRTAMAGTGITEVLEVNVKSGGVMVDYVAQTPHTVVIKSDGVEVDRQDLDRQRSLTTLTNSRNPNPVIFQIEASGVAEAIRLAVPGKVRLTKSSGEGTAEDLARAMAGYYGVNVRIDTTKTDRLHWNFEGLDISGVSAQLQADHGVSADVMANGVVSLK